MPAITLKLRDAARFAKKYPYTRHLPKTQLYANQQFELEIGELQFNDASQATFNFEKAFSVVPNVAIAVVAPDVITEGSVPVNVNAYVQEAKTTHVTIATSAPFTGTVSIQAMVLR